MTEARIQEILPSFAPGARLVSMAPLHGGISATMVGFEVEHPSGEREKFVARQPGAWKFELNPNESEHEYRVLVAVRASGINGPKPRYLSEGDPHPFLILEYIEGAIDVKPADLETYLGRYADQLVQIHRTDLAGFPFLENQKDDYWERPLPWNDGMRETEVREALKQHPPLTSNPRVLRHGDFWPGNVLWREGEIAGVLDWEEAMIGEPLADLAICRLDVWWAFGREASDRFTDMYQSRMNLDLADLAYWDLRAALRPMFNLAEWAGSYPGLGRPDVTEETMHRDHAEFVERALAGIGLED